MENKMVKKLHQSHDDAVRFFAKELGGFQTERNTTPTPGTTLLKVVWNPQTREAEVIAADTFSTEKVYLRVNSTRFIEYIK